MIGCECRISSCVGAQDRTTVKLHDTPSFVRPNNWILAAYLDYRTACLGLILTRRLIPKETVRSWQLRSQTNTRLLLTFCRSAARCWMMRAVATGTLFVQRWASPVLSCL